ncbi:MAG TPA: hypothetical protein VLJ76_11165 [Gaiellaceae bacterium]|nr:hypothetical protein [Gaiellaceae bacterium]
MSDEQNEQDQPREEPDDLEAPEETAEHVTGGAAADDRANKLGQKMK